MNLRGERYPGAVWPVGGETFRGYVGVLREKG